jgi:hypothetical protein
MNRQPSVAGPGPGAVAGPRIGPAKPPMTPADE